MHVWWRDVCECMFVCEWYPFFAPRLVMASFVRLSILSFQCSYFCVSTLLAIVTSHMILQLLFIKLESREHTYPCSELCTSMQTCLCGANCTLSQSHLVFALLAQGLYRYCTSKNSAEWISVLCNLLIMLWPIKRGVISMQNISFYGLK
jgi:hypothetical protein